MVDGYYIPDGTLRLKDYNDTGWYCGFYKGPNISDVIKDNAGWPWQDEDKALVYKKSKLLVDLKALIW